MYILGISAFYHDSAACLVKDGKILAAVQEERLTRIKHDKNFPAKSIKYCLEYARINLSEIEYIVFYEKPFPKFERILETYLAFAPLGFRSFLTSMPSWLKEKLFLKSLLSKEFKKIERHIFHIDKKIFFSEHHLSHAASAFYPSPFNRAAVLTIDGVGEWSTTSISEGNGNELNKIKEINFPHSVGLLYSAFTYFTGFKVNSGEYKLMGLAPYGEPKYVNLIKDNLVDIKKDGSFKLNMDYFDYCVGLKMTNNKFNNLFGSIPRKPEDQINQKIVDIASSIQKVTEEIILNITRHIKDITDHKHLCLAGGVALNCVANGKILKEKIFNDIWIQPASGDAGGAIGAALALYYLKLGGKRIVKNNNDQMKGSYLGPQFSENDIQIFIKQNSPVYEKLSDEKVIEKVAKDISEDKVVGWMNGRMEFGPRALGGRSILASAESKKMQKILNLKIKYRESFRPFAPSILSDDLKDWFSLEKDSPYMLLVAEIKNNKRIDMSDEQKKLFGIEKLNIIRSKIPAVTHVDYTARIQTVHMDSNPKYYKLIKKIKELTGCPVIVNTSFNIRGEPIVCSPDDAFKCFMGTEMDTLVIENFYFSKDKQSASNKYRPSEYIKSYELD
mgnify:CR=1 FL=1